MIVMKMDAKYVVRRAVAKIVVGGVVAAGLFVGLGVVGNDEYETLHTIKAFELDGKTEQRIHLEKGNYLVTPGGKIKASQNMDIVVKEKGKYKIVE